MKMYEAQSLTITKIPPTAPFLVRLDGSKFSTLTHSLDKPFDTRFYLSMLETAKDMMTKFHAVTVYTHSDEITLMFPTATTTEEIAADVTAGKRPKEHANGGRVVKLLTMFAGYCSARFNFHSQSWNPKQAAFFDARLIVFDHPNGSQPLYEFVNHSIWRSCRDCIRNCISAYARYKLGTKKTHGLNSQQLVGAMKDSTGFDFYNDVPMEYQHGVYLKKELQTLHSEEHGSYQRAVLREFKFKIEISEEKNHDYWLEILMAKYAPAIIYELGDD